MGRFISITHAGMITARVDVSVIPVRYTRTATITVYKHNSITVYFNGLSGPVVRLVAVETCIEDNCYVIDCADIGNC